MAASKNKTEKNESHFIDCHNCSMQPVCKPVGVGDCAKTEQSLDLTTNYLTRQIPVDKSAQNPLKVKDQNLTFNNGVLFKQSAPLTAIYAVCSGVFKLCEINDSGDENIVGLRFPGELIGEDSLYFKKYNYTAIAIGDSSVCEVLVDQMTSCGQLVPELQQNFINLLSKQSYVRQVNFQAFIGKKSAESLLAAFVINIIDRNTDYTGSDCQLHLSISRNDIANFLGLRRETLSRVLSKFHKEKLLVVDGKSITILAKDNLAKLANMQT